MIFFVFATFGLRGCPIYKRWVSSRVAKIHRQGVIKKRLYNSCFVSVERQMHVFIASNVLIVFLDLRFLIMIESTISNVDGNPPSPWGYLYMGQSGEC